MAAKPAFCSACGAELDDSVRFCPKCGNATSASAIHTRETDAGKAPEPKDAEERQAPAAPPPPPRKEQPPPPPPGGPQDPGQPAREPRKLPSTPVIAAAVAGLIALIAVITLVALNWEPEPRLGAVSAPNLDPELAGGGLSSSVLGTEVLVGSLKADKANGYDIIADSVNERVIDEFQEVTPSAKWTSEYTLNDGAMTLSFGGAGGDSEFFVDYQGAAEGKVADKIFDIARRYGFYTDDARGELDDIEGRLNSLIDTWNDRSLTEGVPEPDIASDARAIAADLDGWLDDFGDFEPEVEAVEAERAVAEQMAAVADDPTNDGLDEYNRLLDEMNDAIDEYNEAT